MKILITGAGGFVASHMVDYCLEKEDEVIGTIRWNEDLRRLNPKIKTCYVELTDLSSIITAIADNKPHVISHLAAQSWVPYSFINPIYTIETNTIGTLNILEAVRIIKKYIDKDYNPLIHVCSSSEFYGKVEREDLPITENHPANPGNPYGAGKTGADFLSQIYSKFYDLNIVITRMFTHCGIGRSMMSAENYYAKEVALIEAGKKPPIIEISDKKGMNSIRTWADVRDAVKNYYSLFRNKRKGIFNISGETVKSIQEVMEYLISISNFKGVITFKENPKFFRKIDVDKQIVDITKYKMINEWANEITFEQLMNDLLDYWRERIKTEKTYCEV